MPLRHWVIFILIALFCCGLWFKFGFPQFAFVDLSVDKKEAVKKAQLYLSSLGIDTKSYLQAAVFNSDDWADRYLQKTLGLTAEEDFIRRQDYELFSWQVRFFRQMEKEEYLVGVSSKSGEVVNFRHLIEDITPRQNVDKDIARQRAEKFLRIFCGLKLDDYDFHEEKIKRFDKRIDYSFSWEKKGVYIPWQKQEGGAKLLIGATVSGNEVREFSRAHLDIPEKFQRYIENQLIFGEYLSSFSYLFLILLIVWSVFIVVKAKFDMVMRISKRRFLYLAAFFILINLLYIVNNTENVLIRYPTSTQLASYLGLYLFKLSINLIFLSAAFILPGLAGESLHQQVMPEKKYSSLFHYFNSTFFSRGVAASIILGYLLFFIFLGFQAVIFDFGRHFFGVWREWFKLTQLSSAYVPFFSAFVIGVSASLSEEIIFRLFGIHWGKKYLRNAALAVIVMALIWGFGHTTYPVFPVWFRGIEVSLLGLFYGYIFLRYGIIPLIVAHYLFDVFWGSAAYLLGKGSAYLFFGSLAIFILPLAFALFCFIANRQEKERDLEMLLDKTQEYNLNVLEAFITAKKSSGSSALAIKQELIEHNWDVTLIDLAIGRAFKN